MLGGWIEIPSIYGTGGIGMAGHAREFRIKTEAIIGRRGR
jgi:hypothetical protein